MIGDASAADHRDAAAGRLVNAMFRNESVRRIVQNLEACSPSSVSWTVLENSHGERLIVRPAVDGLCPFEIEFEPPDRYGVSFGHDIHLHRMRRADVDPVAVAEAIMLGRVDEQVWLLLGKIRLRASGAVRLFDGRILSDERSNGFLLAPLAPVRKVHYRPYPVRQSPAKPAGGTAPVGG